MVPPGAPSAVSAYWNVVIPVDGIMATWLGLVGMNGTLGGRGKHTVVSGAGAGAGAGPGATIGSLRKRRYVKRLNRMMMRPIKKIALRDSVAGSTCRTDSI